MVEEPGVKRAPMHVHPLVKMIGLRLIGLLGVMFVISILVFSMLQVAPGDIVANILGPGKVSPEVEAAIRDRYGLDDPVVAQYLNWLGRMFTGDFGDSIRNHTTVNILLAERAPKTLTLILFAFVVSVIIAIPLGILSAVRANSTLDRSISVSSIVGLSAPSFAVGLLLLYLFAYLIPIYPIFGGGDDFVSVAQQLTLPALTLALGLVAILIKLTRTSMLRELSSDYITFARARGLPVRKVRMLALRNAAIPIVTSAGLLLTYLVGSTIIAEVIFSIPGLGRLLEEAVLFKDFAVVQFLTLAIAFVIGIIALVVDLLYLAIDPRVRKGVS